VSTSARWLPSDPTPSARSNRERDPSQPSRTAPASACASPQLAPLALGEAEQRPAAALQVEHRGAVHQHDPARPALRPGRCPAVAGGGRPGQGGTPRLRGVGRREHHGGRLAGHLGRAAPARAAGRSRPLPRTAKRRAPPPRNPAGSAPTPPWRAAPVDPGEAADHPLGPARPWSATPCRSRNCLGAGVRPAGAVGLARHGQRQRPRRWAARSARAWTDGPRAAARSGRAGRTGAAGARRPYRRSARGTGPSVSLLSSPAQPAPHGADQRGVIRGGLAGGDQRGRRPHRRAAEEQRTAQPPRRIAPAGQRGEHRGGSGPLGGSGSTSGSSRSATSVGGERQPAVRTASGPQPSQVTLAGGGQLVQQRGL